MSVQAVCQRSCRLRHFSFSLYDQPCYSFNLPSSKTEFFVPTLEMTSSLHDLLEWVLAKNRIHFVAALARNWSTITTSIFPTVRCLNVRSNSSRCLPSWEGVDRRSHVLSIITFTFHNLRYWQLELWLYAFETVLGYGMRRTYT